MPKKVLEYKNVLNFKDVWHSNTLKEWFIVKEQNLYMLRKGSINNGNLELGTKCFKVYQRLGDAKVGLEHLCRERVELLIKQREVFNELQKSNKFQKDQIDYAALDKEAERLRAKWGIKQRF